MPIPDFVRSLRKKIGTDELWLPGVTAVIIRDVPEGAPITAVPEVLLVKRADNGQWTPVTGIADPGEEPHQTAVREAKEEVGLDIQVEALLGVGARFWSPPSPSSRPIGASSSSPPGSAPSGGAWLSWRSACTATWGTSASTPRCAGASPRPSRSWPATTAGRAGIINKIKIYTYAKFRT